MKNKLSKRIFAALGIAGCCMCLLGTPVASLPVKAASFPFPIGIAQPYSDIKEWVFATKDGKLWRRLWNGTKGRWESDWIYVCDL